MLRMAFSFFNVANSVKYFNLVGLKIEDEVRVGAIRGQSQTVGCCPVSERGKGSEE